MRTRFPAVTLYAALAIWRVGSCFAQGNVDARKTDPLDQLPVETLTFSKPLELPGVPQSPAMIAPILCSANGTAFLQILMPPDFLSRAFVGISRSGKSTIYAKGNSFPGFAEVRQMGWFPGDKHVFALVEGRKSPSSSGEKSPWGESILRFGENGEFQGEIDPDTSHPFNIFNFAVLPSGKLIVAGKNKLNRNPELLMLDTSGGNPRTLDLFGSGLYSDEKLHDSYPGGDKQQSSHDQEVSRAVSFLQFVPDGENVLVVQMGTNYPVAEVGDGGIRRTVKLNLPLGVVIESFLPSSKGNWYVRLIDNRKGDQAHIMVAVDPQTGEPLRRVYTQRFPLEAIACKSDGEFLALKQVAQKGSETEAFALFLASE